MMSTRYQDPHPAMSPQMQQYMQQQQMQQQMNNQMQQTPQFTPEMMQQFMMMQQLMQQQQMQNPQMQNQGTMGQQMQQQHMMNLQRQRMMNNGVHPQSPMPQFQQPQFPQHPPQHNTFGFNTRHQTAGFNAQQNHQDGDDNRFGGPQTQAPVQVQQPQRQAIDPNVLIKPQPQEPEPMDQHPTTDFTVESGKFHFTNNSVNFARNQNALSKTDVVVAEQFAIRNYSELFNEFEDVAEKHPDGGESVKLIRSEGYMVNPNILVEMAPDVRAMFNDGVVNLHERLCKTLSKEKRKPELRALSFINEQITKAVNFYLEVTHPGILIDNFVEDYRDLIDVLSDLDQGEPETVNNFMSYMSDFAGPLASEVSTGDNKACFGYTLKALYLRDRFREDLGLELLKDCKVIAQNEENEYLLNLIENEVDFSENYELVILTVDGFVYVVRKVLDRYTIAVV